MVNLLTSFIFSLSPLSDLLYHDAVGSGELQASGEVKHIHPPQHECEHHHRHVGLNARQVQSCCDYHKHRVDEAG